MFLKIGELAKLAGCPVVTIRYYEKEGLLDAPQRTGGNYRLYGKKDIERLRFILHCRKHGITLAEIRQLLILFDNPERECSFAHELVERHLEFVENQISSLQELKEELKALNKKMGCEKKGGCSIIKQLGGSDNCHYCNDLREIEIRSGAESKAVD